MTEDREPEQERREPGSSARPISPLAPVGARQRDRRGDGAFLDRRSGRAEAAGSIGRAAAAGTGKAPALDERDPGVLLLGRQRPEALARSGIRGERVFELG